MPADSKVGHPKTQIQAGDLYYPKVVEAFGRVRDEETQKSCTGIRPCSFEEN